MSVNTYEYECMRAELLGIEKPNLDEFIKKQKEHEKREIEDEEIDIENMKEIELECGSANRVTGRLEELNNILKRTQSKINTFKNPLGSLMTKVSERWNSQTSLEVAETTKNGGSPMKKFELEELDQGGETPDEVLTPTEEEIEKARKSDLARALDTDLSRLDSMIEKAENAQYSMAHQSRQMKKFMK